jgi:hypothetical protein
MTNKALILRSKFEEEITDFINIDFAFTIFIL